MERRGATTVRTVRRRFLRTPTFEPLEPRSLLAAIILSDDAQLTLELINRARANPAAEAARLNIGLNAGLLPGTLSPTPKPPLAPNQVLIDVAVAHTRDMLQRNFFDHTNPDGAGPGDRLAAAGYPMRSAAENLAIDANPSAAHDALFRSAGHRVNMLRPGLREVGVGIDAYGAWGVIMTELFADRAGDAFLTGVAFSDWVVADDFYTPGEGLADVTIIATARGRGAIYRTTTSSSGGYALQVPPDTYDLVAIGGELREPIEVSGVVLQTQNVKVDFAAPGHEPPTPVPPSARDDRAMTMRGVSVVIDVLANDFSHTGLAAATIDVVAAPLHGQAVADPETGRIEYSPAAGWAGRDAFTYRVQDSRGLWSADARVFVTTLEPDGPAWRNPQNPLDVNADGKIGPIDVLMLVNDLNARQSRALPDPSPEGIFPSPYLDVSGDGRVDPRDVLIVVAYLNVATVAEGEVSNDRSAASGGEATERGADLHASEPPVPHAADSSSELADGAGFWSTLAPATVISLDAGRLGRMLDETGSDLARAALSEAFRGPCTAQQIRPHVVDAVFDRRSDPPAPRPRVGAMPVLQDRCGALLRLPLDTAAHEIGTDSLAQTDDDGREPRDALT